MNAFAKSILRQLLSAVGYEIYRAGGVRRTLAEVLDHAAGLGLRPATVIDVGVADGTPELYEAFPKAKHILIEPLQEYARPIAEILRRYDAEHVCAAASDEVGVVELHVHGDMSSSSTLRETEGRHVDGLVRRVPAVTIDQICRDKRLAGPYVIKADVQGAELRVLDGAGASLASSELILLEVSLFQFYVGGPQFYDVINYMNDRGFVVYEIFGGHNRPLDGALAQVDLAFVKKDGMFRITHAYATDAQRRRMLHHAAVARRDQ
jgi:FkbM family methyltransferase